MKKAEVPVRFSRRAFLAGAGGGLIAIASATAIWRSRRSTPPSHGVEPTAEAYVDHEGWMVTAADQKRVARDQLAVETQ